MSNTTLPNRPPRIWNDKGFVPFRLEVLTPVFIGSGEDFSPLEYVIRRDGQAYYLHLVDTAAWLEATPEGGRERAALESGDLLALRRLLNDDERLDLLTIGLAKMRIAEESLAKNLIRTINNPQSNSKAEIMGFTRNPFTHAAFVPGSSIKGALSTPLIDSLNGVRSDRKQHTLKDASRMDERKGYTERKEYTDTLKAMFGDISDHAMQALKVADISIGINDTEIKEALELRLKPGKTATPKTPCEVLPARPASGLPLYGSLHLDSARGGGGISLPGGDFLDLQELRKLCNEFYSDKFEAEWQKFYQLSHFKHAETLAPLYERVHKLDCSTEILLRLGRYSHVECVTVRDNAPNASKGFGKTRTLADGVLPFGWVILKQCDIAEYTQGIAAIEQAIQEEMSRREHRRACRLAQQASLQAEREQAEAKRQQEELAKAERKALLDSLTDEERPIRLLEFEDATEEQASTVFNMLDTLPADLQVAAAKNLRTFWQRIGKWEGKGLSKKQQPKTQKVKAILGC